MPDQRATPARPRSASAIATTSLGSDAAAAEPGLDLDLDRADRGRRAGAVPRAAAAASSASSVVASPAATVMPSRTASPTSAAGIG